MDGNIIIVGENCIAGFSESFGARLHRHPLIELYAACDGDGHVTTESGELQGEIIAIGPNSTHAIADSGKPGIALFLDPLTECGYSLWRYALGNEAFRTRCSNENLRVQLGSLENVHSGDALRSVCEGMLSELRGEDAVRPFDSSVLRVIDLMADEDCEYDMDALANRVFLSKSRLAHVFSEQTGVTLKEYLQDKRLESACRKMLRGMNITQAAYDSGFSGSSHIASSSIKLTGMQLRKLLNL